MGKVSKAMVQADQGPETTCPVSSRDAMARIQTGSDRQTKPNQTEQGLNHGLVPLWFGGGLVWVWDFAWICQTVFKPNQTAKPPNQSCTWVFSDDDWKAMQLIVNALKVFFLSSLSSNFYSISSFEHVRLQVTHNNHSLDH